MEYSKIDIIEFLKEQTSIKDAIRNIHDIKSDKLKVVNCDDDKVLFYFDKDTSDEKIKYYIIKYMEKYGWEKTGYEDILSLKELMENLNLKIK